MQQLLLVCFASSVFFCFLEIMFYYFNHVCFYNIAIPFYLILIKYTKYILTFQYKSDKEYCYKPLTASTHAVYKNNMANVCDKGHTWPCELVRICNIQKGVFLAMYIVVIVNKKVVNNQNLWCLFYINQVITYTYRVNKYRGLRLWSFIAIPVEVYIDGVGFTFFKTNRCWQCTTPGGKLKITIINRC